MKPVVPLIHTINVKVLGNHNLGALWVVNMLMMGVKRAGEWGRGLTVDVVSYSLRA